MITPVVRPRPRRLVLSAIVAGAAFAMAGQAVAAPAATLRTPAERDAARSWPGVRGAAGSGDGLTRGARITAPKNDRVTVFLHVESPSAVSAYRGAARRGRIAARDASRRAVATNTARASAMRDLVREEVSSAREVFRSTRLTPGIAVDVPAKDVAILAALPGVQSVQLVTPKRVATANAAPVIRAPHVWNDGPAGTGQGVRIGVIDTGIDYTHADFGGPGTSAAYNAARASTTFAGTTKVAGGWDFAGDAYAPESGVTTPQPDANPVDCEGHGTHVAGIAAGYGVTTAGSRYGSGQPSDYTGADQPGWMDQFTPQGIGPGVAPLATLYALKVFGCGGSTALVIPALEWATDPNRDGDVSDHLDVVNLSLGSDFTSPQDPDAAAVNAAVQAGITVVAAAGNTGDIHHAIGAPGNAVRAITVAATNENPTQAGEITSFSSRGGVGPAAVKPDVSAPGARVASANVGTGFGAVAQSGTSMATPVVAGQAALVRAAHPTWTPEQVKAAIVGTAREDVRSIVGANPGTTLSATRAGAGRVDAERSVEASTLVFSAEEPGAVGVSFGAVAATTDLVQSRRVTVQNLAPTGQTYAVGVRTTSAVPGVTYRTSADSGTITVPAGGTAELTVELVITRQALRRVAPPGVATEYDYAEGAGFPLSMPRQFSTEAAGLLEVTPVSGPAIRVPVAASVRAASTLTVPAKASYSASNNAATVTLSGTDVSASSSTSDPGAVYSRGQGFALAATSSRLPACSTATPTGCLPYSDAASADLRYIGVTSNARRIVPSDEVSFSPAVDNLLTFAVSTYGPWRTPAGDTSVTLYLDVDRNRSSDYALRAERSQSNEDLFFATLYAITANGWVAVDAEPLNGWHSAGNDYGFGGVDTAPFHSDTLTLPVFTGLLDAPSSRINYRVVTDFSAYGQLDAVGSTSSWLTVDAVRPAVRVNASGFSTVDSTYRDRSGGTLTVYRHAASYATDRVLGELFVHFHNTDGTRVERRRYTQRQTITIPTAFTKPHRLSERRFALKAKASSGLPVTIRVSPSSVCTYSSGWVTVRRAGICSYALSQSGNSLYEPATTRTGRFRIS
ncbi:MAG: S8 family serine peptidase [Actinomycetota bacterium]